ncbi:MAG: BREX-1 system adenine-specific DNA-methyltransferase PglX [Candidatus Gastranaerophilales bacterium]|nr:BREX-1 system adenine-specific DNA-methyltransferase PglX [Candidatus Gastranaerophilales bacterium]MCM1072327.1 BREX-1 system adenine-specific DNA-methyltransferase PglX [Bacteroides sp.]
MDKNAAKENLKNLISEYEKFISNSAQDEISEETIRGWLNKFLEIFDWDVRQTNEILQERKLKGAYAQRLKDIESEHNKPDYTFVNGKHIKTFLDAKSLKVDIFNDNEVAFQIRSYGWSAMVPCAFVSNFSQLVIYDCTFTPNIQQDASLGTRKFTYKEYLDNFDFLYNHFNKENVYKNCLEIMYSPKKIEGTQNLDNNFTEFLSEFRFILAGQLIRHNNTLINNINLLNFIVQIIIDRIIFIRVCESRGFEQIFTLKNFIKHKDGFWNKFKHSCYFDFYEHYDGAMFSLDHLLDNIEIDNRIFEDFINKLYYPSPYKFNVIHPDIIAKIYEGFLSKELKYTDGIIQEDLKPDYIKTNGVIPTPSFLVQTVCNETIDLDKLTSVEELFKVKILDPCCGSGIFLINCFDILSKKLLDIIKVNPMSVDKGWYVKTTNSYQLTIKAKQQLFIQCIHGVDYDAMAVEVTKMSLALKLIDIDNTSSLAELGAFGKQILKNIHKNILLGNTLVDTDIELPIDAINEIRPFDIKQGFKEVFEINKGFTYIIGNPPYVETKHYKNNYSQMHKYIKEHYNSYSGKVDLAVIFIERCKSLLSNAGSLGFIVQKRWFKTDYGINIRNAIYDKIIKILDFEATDLFEARITYVAIIIIQANSTNKLNYGLIKGNKNITKAYLESSYNKKLSYVLINNNDFKDRIWSFAQKDLLNILNDSRTKFGTIEISKGIDISVGIQLLWKKLYQFHDCKVNSNTVTGINGLGESVVLEKDIVKPLIKNDRLYCFKELNTTTYCLFPYKNAVDRIPFKEMPDLAKRYLTTHEKLIKEEVKHRAGDYWHTFTRENNHTSYNKNKIIVPMTHIDTIATFVKANSGYMDNANVYFITLDNSDLGFAKATTAILNSTIFSVFAKLEANPQSGGYYKFSKQFLNPVPLPIKKLEYSPEIIKTLSGIVDEIKDLQTKYIQSTPDEKFIYKQILNKKWKNLDEVCFELYELSDREKALIMNEGRTTDRVDLLNLQEGM